MRLRAAFSELKVLQSGQQLAVSQAVTVVMRPEKVGAPSHQWRKRQWAGRHCAGNRIIGGDTRYLVRLETVELVTVRVPNAGLGSGNGWRISTPVRVHLEQHSARILTA